MSIELLPPDPTYPRTFHVRPNYCRCHPETCGCNDWALFDPDGKRVTTFYHEEDAEKQSMRLRRKMWTRQIYIDCPTS